jgi:stage II sporulation protein D
VKFLRLLGLMLLFCAFSVPVSQAQMLDVLIEPMEDLTEVTLQSLGEETILMTQDSFPVEITRLNTLQQVVFRNEAGTLRIYREGKLIGSYGPVWVWTQDSEPRFKLIIKGKTVVERIYADQLYVRPSGRFVKMVNHVHLENYVTGVIHAEAGHHKSLDFFKVQAVSARTYALRHLGRHTKEGYDVCDKTHCQAYNGFPEKADLLRQAVAETRAEVAVYNGTSLIDAVFSANCGGFTANSEDVWIASVEYLRAVPDYNFCEGFINHAWHMTIPKLDFLAKLGRYHDTLAYSFQIVPDVSGRVKRILVNDNERLAVSGEELRRLFKFKSAKFHVYDSNDLLFIEGEGFGHGVGMCQDGAYFLSETGMDYRRIILHYYQGVEIMPLEEVKGFFAKGKQGEPK